MSNAPITLACKFPVPANALDIRLICRISLQWYNYPTSSCKGPHGGKQGATVAELLSADSADGKDGKFWGLDSIVISSLLS